MNRHVSLLSAALVAGAFAISSFSITDLAFAQNQATPPTTAPAAGGKLFPMAELGTLTLGVPADWKDSSVMGADGGKTPSVVDVSARDDVGPIRVQITSIPKAQTRPQMLTDEGMKRMCESIGQRYVRTSKEKKINFVEFEGNGSRGFSFTLNDETGNAGPYRSFSGTIMRFGDAIFLVMYYHQSEQPTFVAAREMVKSATLTTAAVGENGETAAAQLAESVEFASANDAWSVQIPKLKLSPSKIVRRVNGNIANYVAVDRELGVHITADFEPAVRRGGATIARTYYHNRLKQSRAQLEKVKLEGNDQRAILRYIVGGVQNISVYLVNDKTWVDVHFSYSVDDADAKKLIEDAVTSVRAVE